MNNKTRESQFSMDDSPFGLRQGPDGSPISYDGLFLEGSPDYVGRSELSDSPPPAERKSMGHPITGEIRVLRSAADARDRAEAARASVERAYQIAGRQHKR